MEIARPQNKIRKIKDEKFENWHKPVEYDADGEEIVQTKFQKPPLRFENNFLQKLDCRTVAFKVLTESFNEVAEDLGSKTSLSHIQSALVERYVFLEYFLKSLEAKIATNPKKSSRLIARWVQSLNCFLGLSKTLGLERRTKKIENLSSYVMKNKKSKT